jgi:hypothetical protein
MLILSAVVAGAAPASARTYLVSGQQVTVGTTSTMSGGLIGTWTYTSQSPLISGFPLFHWAGTEHFDGCLNRHRDLSCRHDPKGTLDFSYDAWAMAAGTPSAPIELWGACVHPVTSGTGAFAGAQGVLAMIDTVTPNGILTRYDGNLILAGPSDGDASPQSMDGPSTASVATRHQAPAARRACGNA